MKVENTDLAKQLEAETLGARLCGPEGVSSTLEMTDEQLAARYPDGPKALPPELGGGEFEG